MKIQEVCKILNKFSQLDPALQLSQMLILLEVAKAGNTGTSLSEVSKNLDMGLANASRNVAILGKVNRARKEGFQLIESNEHPMDRRLKILSLTFKGKLFIKDLLNDDSEVG